MKEITLRKIWKRTISIRGYIVRDCIDKNESLTVRIGDEFMIFSPRDLEEKRFKMTKREFSSKYNPVQQYDLVDYQWKPERKEVK